MWCPYWGHTAKEKQLFTASQKDVKPQAAPADQVDTYIKEHKHLRAGLNEHQFYFPLRETRLINSANGEGKKKKKTFH